jgi:hypothetical protein
MLCPEFYLNIFVAVETKYTKIVSIVARGHSKGGVKTQARTKEALNNRKRL